MDTKSSSHPSKTKGQIEPTTLKEAKEQLRDLKNEIFSLRKALDDLVQRHLLIDQELLVKIKELESLADAAKQHQELVQNFMVQLSETLASNPGIAYTTRKLLDILSEFKKSGGSSQTEN